MDFRVLRDPDFPEHQLLASLYSKLHRVLVGRTTIQIAVSFPGYTLAPPQLGDRLRCIGTPPDLASLVALDWLGGMRSFVAASTVSEVPVQATYRSLRRVQAKSNPERLRRRQMRRHGITTEEARQRIPDAGAERLRLPFLQLSSSSTGQHFRLFLKLGPAESAPVPGSFNAFGLSSTATIPVF
ncbi:type I-F CRISPR-associated endoribonuclease Cas6/Csy4 [Gemmatimonas sp.]|uniref:type I-F CRISPR-associated endoribonuclease Cas6/Csy4 n=1 Tax=Gemmatimonas sp. TaxID=1962908 RepID=UPI0031F2F786